MSIIDIRYTDIEEIDKIRFAGALHATRYSSQASMVTKASGDQVFIYEGDNEDSVRINSKQHAEDLIKALGKAIELGWLK